MLQGTVLVYLNCAFLKSLHTSPPLLHSFLQKKIALLSAESLTIALIKKCIPAAGRIWP